MSVFPPLIQARMWWASHSDMAAVHPSHEQTPCTANIAMRWATDASRLVRPIHSGTELTPSTCSRKSVVPSMPRRTSDPLKFNQSVPAKHSAVSRIYAAKGRCECAKHTGRDPAFYPPGHPPMKDTWTPMRV